MDHTATYSAEENKLRLYPAHRISAEDFAAVKAAGFRWAPKQELFVCPRWTPAAEDFLLDLCGEIGDEDYSPEERSADRAERFSGYRDKRRGEAHDRADTFQAGPTAFGHQNLQRAERQAAQHDRHRTHAISQWSKAEYWQSRTEGVIAHALHKSDPAVRRGRIKRLEAEQRKHEKERAEAVEAWCAWQQVRRLETQDLATAAAVRLAGNSRGWHEYHHPRTDRKSSLYGLLSQSDDPITGHEAAYLYFANTTNPTDEGTWFGRWSRHYELRLAYERAMLANEGGTAADVAIEPGGWFGKHQVQSVNRSNVTGKVVSVKLLAPQKWWRGDGPAPLTLQSFNIERLGEAAYRAPTDGEREAFAAKQVAAKDAARASAKENPKPQLINPTDADAERLQALWNVGAKYPSQVWRMTQDDYAARVVRRRIQRAGTAIY